MKNKIFSLDALSWFVLAAIVILYGLLYAPYGLENNDGGFILGLAHQTFLGSSFFDDIVYVRPPVSPILHSFVFHYPFASAPVFADRFFVFLEIATYSVLSARLAQKLFSWGSAFTAVAAAIIFVFAAHAFPPMGWHTIDGIFFSVIALYLLVAGLNERPGLLFLSACFAMLAAGSKQSYYLTPLVLAALSLVLGKGMRAFFIMSASLVVAGFLFLLAVQNFGSLGLMWGAISSQTSLGDLFLAGVRNYAADLVQVRSLVIALPLFAVLTFGLFSKKANIKIQAIALLVILWAFLLIVAQFYAGLNGWAQPLSIFDSVFIITFLYSGVMVLKTRQDAWLVIAAMHVIAWASSISWGYLTAVFYPAPSVITLAFLLHPACKKYTPARILSVAVLPASVLLFYFANQFSYSLEGPVRRASITADMAEVNPALRFIRAEPEKFQLYRELTQLLGRFGDRPYVVLPNMPMAHMLTHSKNPIGIDWVLNAEVGKNEQALKERLASSVDFAIVYKKASPKPESAGKFGSNITVHVTQNWKLIETSANFSVYANPSRSSKLAHD